MWHFNLCAVHFTVTKFKPARLLEHKTPSQVSMNDIENSGVQEVPIYYHQFAMRLYDFYTEDKPGSGSFKVDEASITDLWEKFQFATNLSNCNSKWGIRCDEDNVMECELTQTAIISQALNNFIQSHQQPMQCLHQLPVYHAPGTAGVECADFYVVSRTDDQCTPILVGDFKTNNYACAYKETIAYLLRISEKSKDHFGLLIGLVLTRYKANLLISVSLHKKLLIIKMFANPVLLGNKDKFKKFFSLLLFAVCELQANPMVIFPEMLDTVPLTLGGNLSTSLGNRTPKRVFLHENKVYKIFDYTDKNFGTLAPNIEVIETIRKDYLPGLKLEDLSSNKKFQCLEYNYLDGQHKPYKIKQFLPILDALKKLHDNNYVHSDVRKWNLVFHSNGDDAWLIDFDLAGKVGTKYPINFNHQHIDERHSSARSTVCS